jgi:peptide chain release factor 1
LAQEELQQAKEDKERLSEELKLLLLPRDPNDDKNVILEIRGGVGGEEGALFAADLLRMYTMYAERRGWQLEIASCNETELGGIKEVSLTVEGEGAYSRLKFEAGTHRVQRVPATESQGRIHTSAATVAVMPEADEVDVNLRPEDLRIDVYRASGAGGQHVNKTESAVRITHIPTGIVAQCQNQRSQQSNRDSAMRVLKARLYAYEQSKRDAARQADYAGKDAIAFGSQIRTYTLQPYRLVKDHRTGCEAGDVDAVLDGRIDAFLRDNLLYRHEQAQK